ncbi:Ulp1 peptidase [Bertholletia excelsa]
MRKKQPINLDWNLLLPDGEDEPPPELVVTAAPAPATATSERELSPQLMDCDQQEQSIRNELSRVTNSELDEMITRQKRTLETLSSKLPDGGEKLRDSVKRLEEERERRKLRRVEKDDDGCEMLTKSRSPYSSSASDGLQQEISSSVPASQSIFTTHFSQKLDEDQTESRTVNAFEGEISCLSRCRSGKLRQNGFISPREGHRSAFSSRKSPFQCPTNLSVDVETHTSSNGESPCHSMENSPRLFYKKSNASQVRHPNLRSTNGKTVVLVDEEPELMESMEQADKVDECMKDSKIYYPSSDDPESVEICYSDMECLAPETYLSSTIMNFYIRFLQEPTSTTERGRCDYHFFNTYFYNKLKEAVLTKNDRGKSFIKFRRWWKGVNIFHKAYILIPIHESLHWSLAIICFPDKEDESGPIILHLDSLGLHNSKQIFVNIRSFLKEEWNYLKQGEAPSDLPIADRIWKHLPRRIEEKTIAVPQQRNEYDCGLFVLYFMERFIDEAPQRLKKKDLAMFGKKWFKPEEASNLRRKIRNLLLKEFRNAAKDISVLDHKSSPLVGQSSRKKDR